MKIMILKKKKKERKKMQTMLPRYRIPRAAIAILNLNMGKREFFF